MYIYIDSASLGISRQMCINAQTAFAKCSLALSLELCFFWVPVCLHLGWHVFWK